MVQESWPWPGTTVGDAGPYSDDDWDNMWETLYGSGGPSPGPYLNRGVIRNWLNELEVTDPMVAGRVDVDTGAALVHGKFYRNTAMFSVVDIQNSVGAWREDTIFLRAVWGATRTIRIYRHKNSLDVNPYETPPSIDNNVWHIPLAAVRINGAGTITLITDLREYVSDLMQAPKSLFVRPYPWGAATRGILDPHEGVRLDANGEGCNFEFMVPYDFTALLSAEFVFVEDATEDPGTFDWTFTAAWATCGELYNIHGDVASDIGAGVLDMTIGCINVAAALTPGLTAGDFVGCILAVDNLTNIAQILVLGLRIRYK